MKIYSSLTRRKEEFTPVHKGKVGMYACGVTPYKPSHLGHAMQGIVFDVIRRYFEYKGYDVTYVRNYTDIEDRIVERAKAEGIDPLTYSQRVIDQCTADFKALRVKEETHTTKVSDFIPQIIEAVQKLIEKGNAYATQKGNVYFSVATFPAYGKLSGRKTEEQRVAVRKDLEEDKRAVVDFALWKSSPVDEFGWDSPWGQGRPGWHIECSVMSMHYIGETLDIHGGGADLIFPHHENEIAQSESLTGHTLANFWVHNGLLMVGGEKMSKSLHNDIEIRDWLKKYHTEVIRYLFLTNHYRSHVQFVPQRYVDATKTVYQVYKTLARADEALKASQESFNKVSFAEMIQRFEAVMDDDFNTVPVIAFILQAVKEINGELDKGTTNDHGSSVTDMNVRFIRHVGNVIGLFDLDASTVIKEIEDMYLQNAGLSRTEIDSIVSQRSEVRKREDFILADSIRDELLKKGISVVDGIEVTTWELSFNSFEEK